MLLLAFLKEKNGSVLAQGYFKGQMASSNHKSQLSWVFATNMPSSSGKYSIRHDVPMLFLLCLVVVRKWGIRGHSCQFLCNSFEFSSSHRKTTDFPWDPTSLPHSTPKSQTSLESQSFHPKITDFLLGSLSFQKKIWFLKKIYIKLRHWKKLTFNNLG